MDDSAVISIHLPKRYRFSKAFGLFGQTHGFVFQVLPPGSQIAFDIDPNPNPLLVITFLIDDITYARSRKSPLRYTSTIAACERIAFLAHVESNLLLRPRSFGVYCDAGAAPRVVGNSIIDTVTAGIRSNFIEYNTGHIAIFPSSLENPSLLGGGPDSFEQQLPPVIPDFPAVANTVSSEPRDRVAIRTIASWRFETASLAWRRPWVQFPSGPLKLSQVSSGVLLTPFERTKRFHPIIVSSFLAFVSSLQPFFVTTISSSIRTPPQSGR